MLQLLTNADPVTMKAIVDVIGIALIVLLIILGIALMATVWFIFKLKPKSIGPIIMSEETVKDQSDRYWLAQMRIEDCRTKEFQIKHGDLLASQMDYADHILQDFENYAISTYLGILHKYRTDDNEHQLTIEEKIYAIQAENYTERIRKELRRAFKKNGFHAMNEKEFDQYLKEELSKLYNIVERHTDLKYVSKIIPIEEVREENRKRSHEYASMLRDIFIHARMTASDKKDQIMLYRDFAIQIQEAFIKGLPIPECPQGGCI